VRSSGLLESQSSKTSSGGTSKVKRYPSLYMATPNFILECIVQASNCRQSFPWLNRKISTDIMHSKPQETFFKMILSLAALGLAKYKPEVSRATLDWLFSSTDFSAS
jgi:hypothetical protein